jgi:hypothetical protein
MLGATAIAIFFIPMFYVLLSRFAAKSKNTNEANKANETNAGDQP